MVLTAHRSMLPRRPPPHSPPLLRMTKTPSKPWKNDAGVVVAASINRREESGDLVQRLSGLPNLETLKLAGVGITDAGF